MGNTAAFDGFADGAVVLIEGVTVNIFRPEYQVAPDGVFFNLTLNPCERWSHPAVASWLYGNRSERYE